MKWEVHVWVEAIGQWVAVLERRFTTREWARMWCAIRNLDSVSEYRAFPDDYEW